MTEKTDTARGRRYRLGELRCEGCGQEAELFAPGWRAYGPDGPDTDELPVLAFYCPDCAPPGPAAPRD